MVQNSKTFNDEKIISQIWLKYVINTVNKNVK